MRLGPQDAITGPEREAGLKDLIRNGLYTQGMISLTEGVFLTGLALALGASNIVIGLMAAIPFFAQFLQIPSVWLIDRLRRRKALALAVVSLSRVTLILIGLVPFLAPPGRGSLLLVLGLILHMGFQAVGGCCWNSWMHDFIPAERMGSFFSERMSRMTAVSIGLSVAAGGFVTLCRSLDGDGAVHCYGILFLLGAVSGVASIVPLARVPEPVMVEDEEERRFLDTLLAPLKDRNFRQLIAFMVVWNFAVNLAAPFFVVYMLQSLGFSMFLVISFSILSQAMTLLTLRTWGHLVDRFSNKSVLRVCGPAYILCVLGWTFTTLPGLAPWGVLALLAVLHVAMGVASAGVTLATGNIGLKLAPSGLATSYLATNSLVSAMAAGIAPIIGGATADFFAWRELSAIVRWISPHGMTAFFVMDVQHWGFFFLFAFIIGVYAGHRLFLVREDGEVKETVVVQELVSNAMRDLRSFSPVSQLQSVLEFPIRTVGRRLKQLRQYRYIRTRIISLGSLGDR